MNSLINNDDGDDSYIDNIINRIITADCKNAIDPVCLLQPAQFHSCCFWVFHYVRSSACALPFYLKR